MGKTIATQLSMLMLASLACLSCVKDGRGVPIGPGDSIPSFSTFTTKNQNVTDKDLLGKPSVIVLFSTTCPDCRRQLPEVEAAWTTSGESINVLAVARDEKKETVSAYWSESRFTMPVAAPGNRRIYDLFDKGSGTGVPQVYVADEKGTILLTGNDTKPLSTNDILKATEHRNNL